MAQIHFTVYVDEHKDMNEETLAIKTAGENLIEDMKEFGYKVQGVRGQGKEPTAEPELDDIPPEQQAEIIVQSHALSHYEATHRPEVKARANEILNAVHKSGFSAALFDITTQAFIGRYIHNIVESSEPFDIRDGIWLMGIGYYLGTEGQKWLKNKK